MKRTMKVVPLNVTLRKEDGYFVAECLDIANCVSQGKTEEEATKNIVDMITAHVTAMLEDPKYRCASITVHCGPARQ